MLDPSAEDVAAFTFKDGTKNTFTRSILRVWRKDAGQWKIAATFGLPQYTD